MKNQLITLLLTILFLSNLYSQEKTMIFQASNGKTGKICINSTAIEKNSFQLILKVEWIDAEMNRVSDTASLISLSINEFIYNNSSEIICDTLKGKNQLLFHDKLVLKFFIPETFKGAEIIFNFPLKYLKNINSVPENFAFMRPFILTYNYLIDAKKITDITPPHIEIIEPQNRGFKTIIQENNVKLVIKATDLFGIDVVLINSIEAKIMTDGNYEAKVTLYTGVNNIVIQVKDKSGNVAREEIEIETTYQEEIQFKGTGKYFALIIGINDYSDPSISSLDKPINDASNLYNILTTNYTFNPENVKFIINATYDEIIIALDSLSNIITIKDNFLFFYAGHGYWDEKKELGYWFPSDASFANTTRWI